MNADAPAAALSLSLRLPDEWLEFDPRVPDLVAEIARALEVPANEQNAAVALLAPLALELTRAATDSDVVLAGFFAHAIETNDSAEPLVITANVLLAVSPPLDDPAAATAGMNQVEPVDLPAGAAVLATGQVEITDPRWEGSVPARTRRYLVPVPGTDRLAVLAFQTPNLDLAEQFDDVFAAIAESLAFDLPTTGGTPT